MYLERTDDCASGKCVLHLKECEYRYNHRFTNLLLLIKRLLRFVKLSITMLVKHQIYIMLVYEKRKYFLQK